MRSRARRDWRGRSCRARGLGVVGKLWVGTPAPVRPGGGRGHGECEPGSSRAQGNWEPSPLRLGGGRQSEAGERSRGAGGIRQEGPLARPRLRVSPGGRRGGKGRARRGEPGGEERGAGAEGRGGKAGQGARARARAGAGAGAPPGAGAGPGAVPGPGAGPERGGVGEARRRLCARALRRRRARARHTSLLSESCRAGASGDVAGAGEEAGTMPRKAGWK